jgi:predicted phage terminase large subunit-like protein
LIEINSKYKPLFNPQTRITILTGGRGSGKSHVAPIAISNQISEPTKNTCLFSRYTMSAAEDSIIPEFNARIEDLEYSQYFRSVKNNIYCSNGNKILFRGLKTSSGNQTAKLKSIEGLNIFVLDEGEEWNDEKSFDTIDGSIREKGTINWILIILNPCHVSHWIYQRFFRPNNIPIEFNGVVDGVQYIHTTYLDNLENLSEDYLNMIEKTKHKNLLKYKNLYLGHWQSEKQGALWKQSLIDLHRVYEIPELVKIAVSVDPATTSKIDSDDTGILVVGKGKDNRGYVLEDKSGKYTPREWAQLSVNLYNKWNANIIVAEKNQGGDMVKHTIKTADENVPVKLVHASKGKILRAEPISSLYEDGVFSHVGTFQQLEYEMTTYTGELGEVSPNSLDAMVHGATYLFPIRSDFNAFW